MSGKAGYSTKRCGVGMTGTGWGARIGFDGMRNYGLYEASDALDANDVVIGPHCLKVAGRTYGSEILGTFPLEEGLFG